MSRTRLVTRPQPFVAFVGRTGRPAIRVGRQRPYLTADEIIISATPVRLTTLVDGTLQVTGEGCVRKHRSTIAVTA